MQVISTLVELEEAELIESIPLGQSQMMDKDGWYFTQSGKYTVKFGHGLEKRYPDRERQTPCFGPHTKDLQALS